jgi:antirestriction protein ArdC
MKQLSIEQIALRRALQSDKSTNYSTIIEGFLSQGILAEDIKPRENVFTFLAWKALGRQVKKGEHGVKVVTMVPVRKKHATDESDRENSLMPWRTTVFHVSQTEACAAAADSSRERVNCAN